ncbi:MAG: hypothetical protein M1832_004790 [Thelocarpon impressellum]|nr:MAG: hypothetical protein M1832_004790 [Thelocarpon impressellum]
MHLKPVSSSLLTAEHCAHQLTQAVASTLSDQLTQSPKAGADESLDTDRTSFSVRVFSIAEAESMFEVHHTPSIGRDASVGVNQVDADTVYRIGGVFKVLPAMLFLQHARYV